MFEFANSCSVSYIVFGCICVQVFFQCFHFNDVCCIIVLLCLCSHMSQICFATLKCSVWAHYCFKQIFGIQFYLFILQCLVLYIVCLHLFNVFKCLLHNDLRCVVYVWICALMFSVLYSVWLHLCTIFLMFSFQWCVLHYLFCFVCALICLKL